MVTLKTYVTPVGKAKFPCLRKPEIYNGKVQGLTTKLQLTDQQIEEIVNICKQELIRQCGENPELKGKKFTNPHFPVTNVYDTSCIKFKSTHQFSKKNDDGSTTIVDRVIPFFNKAGQKLPETVDIGHDSEIVISYAPKVYYKSSMNHGVTLYIQAIQVIKLNPKGERTAEGYGFTVDHDAAQYEPPFTEDEVDAENAGYEDPGFEE